MLGDLPYRQDLSRCSGTAGGDAFERALAGTAEGLAALRRAYGDGSLPLLRVAEAQGDLAMIEARAEHHREHADDVVVLGTGGSSLGGQALYALADSGFGPSGDSPRLHFLDNIDPPHLRPSVPQHRPRAHRFPGHLQVGRHGRDAAAVPGLPGGAGGRSGPRGRRAACDRNRRTRRQPAESPRRILGILRHRPRPPA